MRGPPVGDEPGLGKDTQQAWRGQGSLLMLRFVPNPLMALSLSIPAPSPMLQGEHRAQRNKLSVLPSPSPINRVSLPGPPCLCGGRAWGTTFTLPRQAAAGRSAGAVGPAQGHCAVLALPLHVHVEQSGLHAGAPGALLSVQPAGRRDAACSAEGDPLPGVQAGAAGSRPGSWGEGQGGGAARKLGGLQVCVKQSLGFRQAGEVQGISRAW